MSISSVIIFDVIDHLSYNFVDIVGLIFELLGCVLKHLKHDLGLDPGWFIALHF